MSTRCQIGFYPYKDTKRENFDALIYKHSDGYPEGTIPLILPVLKEFNDKRGLDDTEYAAAYLVYKIKEIGLKEREEWNGTNDFNLPYDLMLGVGVSKCFHGDIEYFYHVSPQRISVFRVEYERKKGTMDFVYSKQYKLKELSHEKANP